MAQYGTYDFGKYTITEGGTYSPSETYEENTLVKYDDNTWISLKTVPADTNNTGDYTPSEDSEYWQLICKKGKSGIGPTIETLSTTLLSSGWTGESGKWEYNLAPLLQSQLGEDYNANTPTEGYINQDDLNEYQIDNILGYKIYGGGRHKVFAHSSEKPGLSVPYIIRVATGGGQSSSLVDIDDRIFYNRYSVNSDSIINKEIDTSWSSAPDGVIAGLVELSRTGYVDLVDYWNLGDERQIDLSAMETSGVGDSHSAQTVTFVLMHQELYDLVTPVLDKNKNTRTKCSFVVGMKHCLATTGRMDLGATNSGSWNGCARRVWCNDTFRNSIPSTLRSIFAQFKTITVQTYNGSTNQISNDYFALPAEKEVFGTRSYSNQTEADALTQFWYYASGAAASNKKKIQGGNNAELPSEDGNHYWLRSPCSSNTNNFCYVKTVGSAGNTSASVECGLAPFGCI